MKKFLSIFISICCVLGMAGCGNSGNEAAPATSATQAEEAPITVDGSMQAKTISSGCCFIAVREDGTVAATGCERCDMSGWTDIVQITDIGSGIVGLKSDGTVVTTSEWEKDELSTWTGIVQVAGGNHHVVGLKADGTVVSTKMEANSAVNKGQCDVSSWTDIVAVSACMDNTVGLKADGTVVAAGVAYHKIENKHDRVDIRFNEDANSTISNWTDIVAIAASPDLLAGLKSDGTVVLAGDIEDLGEVKDWKNIVAVDTYESNVFGVKADGGMIATNMDLSNIGNDYIACDEGRIGTIMMKSDGTLNFLYNNKKYDIDKSLLSGAFKK